MDRPLTLLVAHGEPAPARSLQSLARRLAAKLDHDVAACVVDNTAGDSLVAAVRPGIERGASRLVVLPLALGTTPPRAPAWTGPPRRSSDGGRACASIAGRRSPPTTWRGCSATGRARRSRRGAPRRTPSSCSSARGAANPAANAELARLARLVFEAHRFRDVGYAFLDLTAPDCRREHRRGGRGWARRPRGSCRAPCSRGGAIAGWWPRPAPRARRPGVDVAVARPLYPHPALVWALVRRHLEALPDAVLEGDAAPYVTRRSCASCAAPTLTTWGRWPRSKRASRRCCRPGTGTPPSP